MPAVLSCTRAVSYTHLDGDCLGSQLALAHALRAKGKRAVCLLAHDDAVDKSFLFLPGANELIPACEFESDVDAFIAVDVPNLERLGDATRVHAVSYTHLRENCS